MVDSDYTTRPLTAATVAMIEQVAISDETAQSLPAFSFSIEGPSSGLDCGLAFTMPNLELYGPKPHSTALYHTIAASIPITPSYGILDDVLRYNTSLDGLLRHRAPLPHPDPG